MAKRVYKPRIETMEQRIDGLKIFLSQSQRDVDAAIALLARIDADTDGSRFAGTGVTREQTEQVLAWRRADVAMARQQLDELCSGEAV